MGRAFHKHKFFLVFGLLSLCLSIFGSILFFSGASTAHAQQQERSFSEAVQNVDWGDVLSAPWRVPAEFVVNRVDDLGYGAEVAGRTAVNVASGESLEDGFNHAQEQTEAGSDPSNELFHCSAEEIVCRVTRMILHIITALLGLIVSFLGYLVTFAITILIGFAKYNGFATAAPVMMGWVVVRDLVNMFFIIVLLVSAFATIIGYESSFHYTKVLPKLLLMAVLINFSKTLIMLLVDFSQVLMLTFVNAFQQASGANFIRAFKLDKITKMSRCNEQQRPLVPRSTPPTTPPATAGATPGATPPTASGTGVAGAPSGTGVAGAPMTTGGTATGDPAAAGSTAQAAAGDLTNAGCNATQTAVTVTNIILAYLLGIVLLIIALGVIIIMIAYLIARIIGLWIVLIFSPLAFFATALPARLQKGLDTFTGKYWQKLSALLTGGPVIAFFLWLTLATMQSAGSSLPSRGVPSSEGSGASAFLSEVGNSQDLATFIVAIAMLMMGLDAAVNAAQQTSDTVGKFANNVAGLTTSAAKFAALSPLYLGRSGARAIDRRVDITGKASRVALQTPILRTVARKQLTKGLVMRQQEREAMANDQLTDMKHMTKEQKLDLAESMSGTFATPDERVARSKIFEDLGSDESRFKDTKARAATYEAQLKKQHPTMPADEIKRQASARAIHDATVEGGQHLAEARKGYAAEGNMAKVADIDKIVEKNPMLEQDVGKRNALLNKVRLDPEKMKNLSPEALSQSHVVMSMLPPGSVQTDGSGNVTGFDSAQLNAFREQNKDNKTLISNLDAIVDHVDNSVGNALGGVPSHMLENSLLQRDGRGNTRLYDKQNGTRIQSFNEIRARAGVDSEITRGTGRGRSAPGVLVPAARTATANALDAGISMEEVLTMGGEGTDGAVSNGFAQDAGAAFTAADAATDKAGLDTALGAPGVASAISQLESPGMTSTIQMKMLSGIYAGGAGSKAIGRKMKLADGAQRRLFLQVIKVTSERMVDIARKTAAGHRLSPEEENVKRLYTELKIEMPRTAIKNAAGVVTTEAAPAAASKYLYD